MPLLQLTDVHARYGQVSALHGVTLTVEEGEVVALLGANGAGKTTTLRAISGMVARSGELRFDGASLAKSPEGAARRGITHVPEGRGILGELTVWENLTMGAYLRRDRKAVRQDLDLICDELPWLRQRRAQQAGTLSGGEQQMLALARARMSRPRLLLLDEPSLGLAPLVVEQNANVALDVSNRAYLLEVGRVALSGASDELKQHEGIRSSYLGY